MKQKATCIEVKGDIEEFEDLIGATGTLFIHKSDKSPAVNWFNGGNTVSFCRKRVTKKDQIVKVFTEIGNTFIFKLS